jgi:hypothetical protein
VAVFFRMRFGRFARMMRGMFVVPTGGMRMMRGFLVIAFLMVFGGFLMMGVFARPLSCHAGHERGRAKNPNMLKKRVKIPFP